MYDMDSTGSTEFEQDSLERRLRGLSERCLAMQLYYTYQGILACQEAMWEELDDRIRNRKEELIEFGWEDDEELQGLQGRKRFEKLVERYQTWVFSFAFFTRCRHFSAFFSETCKLG
jgi:hypothetical protein